RLGGVRAGAGGGIADAVGVALIGSGADDGPRPDAGAALAGVALRAGIAVVARRAIRLGGIRARTGDGVASAGVVALVGRGTHARIPARADAGLAAVRPGAGAPVGAGGAVRSVRVRAGARGGIAGAGVVALIGGGADDGLRADAAAGAAGVTL